MTCDLRLNTVWSGARLSSRVGRGGQVSLVGDVTLVSLAQLELNLIPALCLCLVWIPHCVEDTFALPRPSPRLLYRVKEHVDQGHESLRSISRSRM